MAQTLNFQSLEDFLSKEIDDISTIHMWYEKLSEYELDGSETPKEVDTIVNAMRYLMNFSFTAAEELKEVAEREAVEIAEREEEWQEEKQQLKEELASMRDRLTISADAGESSEAFRSQIDSLKAENRQLQQMSRDRDREMADQRDRFESLVSRADSLTRERDSLVDHRTQLEDTIRELNRRISAKNEDASNEWESRKLVLRNEQAVTLSKQMQVVVSQNDQLRSEVERVSGALEEATRLIENSSKRISNLTEDLKTSQSRETELLKQNVELREKFEEKNELVKEFETAAMDSSTVLKNKIEDQEAQISTLKDELFKAQVEVTDLRERIGNDTTQEREEELEKLKTELVEATRLARNLFGQQTVSKEPQDQTQEVRMRLMQVENHLENARKKIEDYKKSETELEEVIVQKDVSHSEMALEIERLRVLKFGDAREEIARLETQLKIREDQIARMTNQCTMLQIELGRYAEGLNTQPSKTDTQPIVKGPPPEGSDTQSEEGESMEEEESSEKEKKSEKGGESTSAEETGREMKKEKRVYVRKRVQRGQTDWEQQAMLIAGLNYELMTCLEEIELKNKQLVELEHSIVRSKRIVEENKEQLKLAYEEILQLRNSQKKEDDSELEEKRAEVVELRRLADSIKIGGSELERRAEETARKMVGERIEKIRLSRVVAALRARCNRAEEAARRMRETMVKSKTQADRQMARLQYELDTNCYELAVLQTKLINSVPLKTYEDISLKYRQLVKKEVVGSTKMELPLSINVDVTPPPSTDETIEQVQTKNAYLKKIVSVLSDQNDFWSQETELLQKENKELKKFIEDIEKESDMKGILGAIEHRLLETIREQAETAREHTRERRKKRDAEEVLAKERMRWREERRRLVTVIGILKRGVETLRSNSVGTVTLEQMETLRSKIVETHEMEERAMETRRQAEAHRDQLETQLLNAKSMKRARDAVEMLDADRQRIERTLQTAYNATSMQTARAERLQTTLKLKERELMEVEKELQNLRQQNEEYFTVICNMRIGSEKERLEGEVRDTENQTPESGRDAEESARDAEKEETDYEMDYDSGTSESSSSSQPRTILVDNSAEYKEKIAQMKKTAEICIQAYKEQLIQKDAAIENYRELFLLKMNETTRRSDAEKERKLEIVYEEERVQDEETEQKLAQAMGEIARLKEEVQDLEQANRELYRNKTIRENVAMYNVGLQTEDLNLTERELSMERVSSRIQPSNKSSARSENSLVSIVDEPRDESAKYKNEIRTLKNKIRQLMTTNKQLLAACEKIKEDALEELQEKRRENGSNETVNSEYLRHEIEQLSKTVRFLRKKVEDQKSTITQLNTAKNSSQKDTREEVSRWNERKQAEGVISNLRKRLKEADSREADINDRLEKREKRLDELRREVETRQREIERLNRRIREMKTERDTAVQEKNKTDFLQEKLSIMEESLRARDREVAKLLNRIGKIDAEKLEVLEKLKKLESRETSQQPHRKPLPRPPTAATQTEKRDTVVGTIEVTETMVDRKTEQQLKELRKQLRLWELRFRESTEKVEMLKKENKILSDNYAGLSKKISTREENSGGAVTLLVDKLEAKDREITQLKTRINGLERRLSK